MLQRFECGSRRMKSVDSISLRYGTILPIRGWRRICRTYQFDRQTVGVGQLNDRIAEPFIYFDAYPLFFKSLYPEIKDWIGIAKVIAVTIPMPGLPVGKFSQGKKVKMVPGEPCASP